MPSINAGDTAWILMSTALVMFMTPGLAFFYGGMVRRKNALSTIMMSFMMLALVGVLWVVYGYSLGFGTDIGGIIGGFDFIGLNNVGQNPSTVYASTVPQLAYMAFQGMFAIITVALITGAVVERIKFSSLLVFSVIWFTIVYLPLAHWVWGAGGWLGTAGGIGALDFAGGTVVHINSGVSALALAMLLGPRKGFKDVPMGSHNVPFIVIGAALLWFGWFGFNAGSALTSGGLAANAFVATNTSAAASALTWMFLSWFFHRPTVSGIAAGAVAGLVAITPAAGFVSPIMGIPIGIMVAIVCFFVMRLRSRSKTDDSLDVFACHGIGGTVGAIATGIFASTALTANGGLINGNVKQLGIQLIAVATTWVFSFGMTWIIGKVIDLTMGLRVGETEESVGLDISQHGESAYGSDLQ